MRSTFNPSALAGRNLDAHTASFVTLKKFFFDVNSEGFATLMDPGHTIRVSIHDQELARGEMKHVFLVSKILNLCHT
jgi:hypothetical protein